MLRHCLIPFAILCFWLSSCGSPVVEAEPGSPTIASHRTATSAPEVYIAEATSTETSPSKAPVFTPLPAQENSILPAATEVFTGSLQLEKASLDAPPAFPADLLYFTDGRLMRWDYHTGRPVEFTDQFDIFDPGNQDSGYGPRAEVLDYAVDGSQRWIALLISRGITANGIDLHDIILLDLDTGKQIKLAEKIRRSAQLNFSPDGKWLAYQSLNGGFHHFLIENSPALETIDLGECLPGNSTECEAVIWSPDSRKLLWSDLSGIWYYEAGSQKAVSLLGARLQAQDGSGKVQELPVEYHPLEWSPQGRYATVAVKSKAFDRSWVGLLDTRTGKMVEVPDTYRANDPSSAVSWLGDGRLLAAIGENSPGNPAYLAIWKVLPAHENLLVLDETVQLNSFSATDDATRLPAEGINSIDHVTSLDPRSLCMVFRFMQAEKPPTLYCLDLKYRLFQRFGEVPHDLVQLAFSPDSTSVIMTGSHGSTLYASRDQEVYLDINPLLGDYPTHITWLHRPVAGKPNK